MMPFVDEVSKFELPEIKRYWPRHLHHLLEDAAYKIRLRARRLPDPAKWPTGAVDEAGDRDWRRCSVKFLLGKLREEVGELEIEATEYDQSIDTTFGDLEGVRLRVRYEAADVAAVALMIAERCGAYLGRPATPRIVCLCGSTRFKDAFLEATFRETMAGRIVLSVGFFHHAERERYELTAEEKTGLDALHQQKIDLADEVLILNVVGYVGDSTRLEIEHAYLTGKAVRYLELPLLVCDGQHAEVVPCLDEGCWQLPNPLDDAPTA